MQPQFKLKWLVSKKTVVPCPWGSEIWKLRIKQVDTVQIKQSFE